MLTSDDLLTRWNGLSLHPGAYTRVDPIHPLELYIGHEADQKSLLLLSTIDPGQLPSSKSISVTIGQRNDGKWAVTFRLVRAQQEEMFIHLCCDLIEASRQQANNLAGAGFVIDRFKRWHKLLEHDGGGLLSDAAQKGLFGELLFLQRVLASGMPALDAVNGWMGAEGGDRDFVFPTGWHEVKTTGVGAKTVSISSLEQLDAPPPGELVVFHVDRTAPGDSVGVSLNDIVAEIRVAIQGSAAGDLFDVKLFHRGYVSLKEYDGKRYRLSGIRRYSVDQHFPRLTAANVATQITAATYDISLHALEGWRTE